MSLNRSYTLPVQEDSNGELVLVFPDELMYEIGWEVGDKLKWKQRDDQSWTLEKVDEAHKDNF